MGKFNCCQHMYGIPIIIIGGVPPILTALVHGPIGTIEGDQPPWTGGGARTGRDR